MNKKRRRPRGGGEGEGEKKKKKEVGPEQAWNRLPAEQTATLPSLTCAIDADPTGLSSNSSNTSSIESTPSSRFTIDLTKPIGIASIRSVSGARRSVYALGNRSTRVAMICPALT